MEEQSKIDNLADTMFEIMEDISKVEETIEQRIKIVEALESTINTLKETQDSHIKKLESFDDIIGRFSKLEQNINLIASSEVLKLLNEKIDKKVLLKNEIAKYQKMILFILAFLALGSIAFFMLGLAHNSYALMAFLAIVACFIIALLIINGNLKRAISEDKITPKKQSQMPTPTPTPKPKETNKNNDDVEIKGTFDDLE